VIAGPTNVRGCPTLGPTTMATANCPVSPLPAAMPDDDKLARMARLVDAEPIEVIAGELPHCTCGGTLCFVGGASAAIEWWRCIRCDKRYPVRKITMAAQLPSTPATATCRHTPGRATHCAICGKSSVGVTIVTTLRGHELTAYFCGVACARKGLDPEGD
jgi:hypothetical protein